MIKLNTRANFKTSSSFWDRLRPYRQHTHCHSQRARVPRRPSSKKDILANRYNNTFGSSNTKFCRQTKRIWRTFVRFKSTTVSSARRMVPTVSNVRMNATSASTFGLVSSRALPWSPICPTILYVPGNFVPGLFEDVPLYVTQGCGFSMAKTKHDTGCGFSMAKPKHDTGKVSGSGSGRRIHVGEQDVQEDRMNSAVTRSSSDGIFHVGTRRNTFTQSPAGLPKTS